MNTVSELAVLASFALPEWEIHALASGSVVAKGEEQVEAAVGQVMRLRPGLCELEPLTDLCELVLEEIVDPDMTYSPLLPAEDESLTNRVDALGIWVVSFLEGLEADGVELPSDSKEILEDFKNIAEIDAEVEDSKEMEASYMEVSEFVKISVLLLFEIIHLGATL